VVAWVLRVTDALHGAGAERLSGGARRSLNVGVGAGQMKAYTLFIVFLFASFVACAEIDYALSELNHGLVPVYESLVADGDSAELVGMRIELP